MAGAPAARQMRSHATERHREQRLRWAAGPAGWPQPSHLGRLRRSAICEGPPSSRVLSGRQGRMSAPGGPNASASSRLSRARPSVMCGCMAGGSHSAARRAWCSPRSSTRRISATENVSPPSRPQESDVTRFCAVAAAVQWSARQGGVERWSVGARHPGSQHGGGKTAQDPRSARLPPVDASAWLKASRSAAAAPPRSEGGPIRRHMATLSFMSGRPGCSAPSSL